MLKIDFYFWGDQCPHNSLIRNRLQDLLDPKRYRLNFIDISNDLERAKKLKIFSPNLIIFNGDYRWNGPINMDTIKLLEEGKKPKKHPYRVSSSENIVVGLLKPLNEKTVADSFNVCAPSYGKCCCAPKGDWIRRIKERYNIKSMGYLHYLNEKCVGGAEFVPSLMVPYNIPRAPNIAFLTCVFVSDEKADYKSYPLGQLEKTLREMGFKEVITIASEDVVFPNGPLDWFVKRDYRDFGVINYEVADAAKMHLVKKKL